MVPICQTKHSYLHNGFLDQVKEQMHFELYNQSFIAFLKILSSFKNKFLHLLTQKTFLFVQLALIHE